MTRGRRAALKAVCLKAACLKGRSYMTSLQQAAAAAESRGDTAARSGRPLKVGLNLQIVEGGMAGKTAGWAALLAFAARAEALGFDSLWVPDHLLLTWEEQTRGTWECWSLLP